MLHGCGAAGTAPGVYVASLENGAPGWIGPAGGAPVWSPHQDEIAWGSEDGLEVWRGHDDGVDLIASAPVSGRPAWAPDGSSIAFIDRKAAAVAVVDAANGERMLQIPIVENGDQGAASAFATFGGPAWSPDGARLTFNCRDEAGDELCVVNADGSGLRQITRLEPATDEADDVGGAPASSNVGPPSWSPDGTHIAAAAYPERRGAAGGVFIIDLARGSARRVSSRLPNSVIEWYPDGQALVFSATSKGRSDVIRINVADGAATSLTERLPTGGKAPAISPDGARVSFVSDGEILILGPTGEIEEVDNLGLRGESPAWSSAGDAVAYLAMDNPLHSYEYQ